MIYFNSEKKSSLSVLLNSKRLEISPKNDCRVRISSFNHLDFARNSFELCPTNTARNRNLNFRQKYRKILVCKNISVQNQNFVGGMQNRRRFAPTIFLVRKPFSKNCGG